MLANELLQALGIATSETVIRDYIELVEEETRP